MLTQTSERTFELSLIKQADKVRAALTFFLLVLVLSAPEGVVTNRAAACAAIALAALFTIWTLFFLNLEVLWLRGRLPLVASILLLADVTWLSLFIYGTGGFHSPFESLLLLIILFGAVFFGGLPTALPLAAGIVAVVHVSFAAVATQQAAITWEVTGRLVAVIAVAWLAYGLSQVLERERKVNESVVRNLTEGVLLIDGGQTIVLSNPQIEKVCNLPSDMIVGRRIQNIPQEPGYEQLLDLVADVGQVDSRRVPISRDVTIPLPEPVDLRIITIPCGGSPRRRLGWVVVCQDITDIKAVARMKEDGITILSHEIRSPLASLRAVSQVLSTLADELDTEERAHAIGTIEKETDRLLELVSKLLDVSALEQGTYKLDLEPVRVADVISKLTDMLELQAQPRRISILSECEEGLPAIKADPDCLEQVLVNLCENALKYTPEGGTVKLAAARANGHIEIVVSDNGCGIPPEHRDAIFEKFGQADAAAGIPIVERGIGLGLYIARTIVQLHGGDITVDSTVGEGSTFYVLLPTEYSPVS